MDDEPVAKRRCLSCVQKTFPDIVLQQSRPRKAFAQVQHISIHSEDTLAVKTESLFDTSAHLDCEAVTEKTFKHHVPRNKSLSGLHQATYDQDETTAHNSVRSISSAVRIHGNNGVHQANDGHRGMKGDNEVCFGMFAIPNITVLEPKILSPQATIVSVELVNRRLTTIEGGQHSKHPVGSIDDKHSFETMQQMQNKSCLRLQMYCRTKSGFIGRTQVQKKVHAQCELSVIVYGPSTISDSVGDYLQACGFYLQDPEHCDCNVPYANPHCLSSLEEGILMTSSLQIPASTVERIHNPSDILNSLSSAIELEETETPAIIKTPLKSHQKEALTFLLRRERGWALDSSNDDVWTRLGGLTAGYCNNVTGERQSHSPPQFRGGIMADQMGLGKTLQMIALIASDFDKITPTGPIALEKAEMASTLVVVPFPLLETWTDQLKRHVRSKTMTWHVYHGRRRKSEVSTLAGFNIVLTTYETVVSDKKRASHPVTHQKSLFDITWQRVILDEAHFIGRRSTLKTQAVCSLNAHCRWAVTGTPVQNRLTELGTLLHFLRVHPFDDLGFFDKEFIRPWKMHSDPSVLDRLRALVRFITLRRSKELLRLMPREDHVRRLQFSSSEQELYNIIKTRTRDTFHELFGPQTVSKADYFNVLAWIDNLRRTCNHIINHRLPLPSIQSKSPRFQDLGNDDDVEIPGFCPETIPVEGSSGLDLIDYLSQHSQDIASRNPGICSPASIIPDNLATPMSQSLFKVPSHGRSSDSRSPRISERTSPDRFATTIAYMAMPTKIERLVRDLTDSDQKSVVFSFWKTTLDLIPPALEAAGIGYTRLDGKLTKSQRSRSLQGFRTDANVKVLLATLSVAGFGLDLTVATQAFILEPQWNPMAEEQALSRIHRMGQTKAVKTVRYIMQDSIEENIYELQQRKLKLAALTISGEVQPTDQNHIEDLRFLLS